MKKILAVLMILCLLFACVACVEEEAPAKKKCPSCDEKVSVRANYCEHCGVALKDKTPTETPTAAPDKTPECSHSWQEADCNYPKICVFCGATEGTALGHDFGDNREKCAVCGTENPDFVPTQWRMEGTTLYVSGVGDMQNFRSAENYPWYQYSAIIQTIIVEPGITGISQNAFGGCANVETVILPEGLTVIGDSAFSGKTKLKQIEIPSTVTTIAYGAFSGSGLTSVSIPYGVTVIERDAFSWCNDLETVVFPGSLKVIEMSAFAECRSLNNLEFPNGLETIGSGAFCGNDALKELVFPESVTTIESGAFLACPSLTKVTIPSTVTQIGSGAFTANNYNYDTSGITICCTEGSFAHQYAIVNEHPIELVDEIF